ncbi:N-acetylmuramoyl-L-alanine amidase CwlD [Polycladospora coralii]|nr:N-acetylmuramoyl-L-alanine amidase CwlD [Polycladospora coralii]
MRVKRITQKTMIISLSFIAILLLTMTPVSQWLWEKQNQDTWTMPFSGKFIILDPGHGGVDGGAVSRAGLVEKEVTLKIAQYLRDYLQEAGAYVVMTREEDKDLADPDTKRISRRKAEDLMKRVRLIKQKNADALITIHLNAFPSSRYHGAQTFYNPKHEENKKLAELIQSELIENLENTDRIAKQKSDIYILKSSDVPTVLVEAGFLSNPDEAALLATDGYQKKVAASIYTGLIKYYTGEEPTEK